MRPFPHWTERLQPHRHRSPVIVAVEPGSDPERLRWWEAARRPAAEAGAALEVITARDAPPIGEGPAVWILDAYLEPRARLDASRLDPGLLDRILAWVEGIQHECPE